LQTSCCLHLRACHIDWHGVSGPAITGQLGERPVTEDALIFRSPSLVFAALQPVYGRPLARPAVGSRVRRRRAPDTLALLCLRRFFGCCPDGLYVSAPACLAPPASGPVVQEFPAGAPSSLTSGGNFLPLALRVDRPPSATARKLRQQPKTTGGEGSWPVTLIAPPTTIPRKGCKNHERHYYRNRDYGRHQRSN
jgi:hypothetical protein